MELVLANLVSLWVETLLYGVYLVILLCSVYILVREGRQRGHVNVVMVLASFLMFLLISGHMVLDFVRAISAFTDPSTTPLLYYANIMQPTEWTKSILYYLLSVVGDAIVLYRCWIVWQGRVMIMILPSLLYLADVVIGAIAAHAVTTIRPGQAVYNEKLFRWALAFFSLTVTTNTLCTLLIAFRIWQTSHAVAKARLGKNKMVQIIMILVESAAIYTCALIAMIILYKSGDNASFITLDLLSPVVGIVFGLIIVRVSLGISSEGQHFSTQGSHFSSSHHSRTTGSIPLKPVQVHISHTYDSNAPTLMSQAEQGLFSEPQKHGLDTLAHPYAQ